MLWWKIRQLKSTRRDVRLQTLKDLAGVPDPRLKAIFIQLLAQDPDADVRKQAYVNVSQLEDDDRVVPLIEALNDQNDGVRITAAKALGNTRDERAISLLIAALKDKNDAVKTTAAKSLGDRFDKRAIPYLAQAMLQCEGKTQEKIEKQLILFGSFAVPEFLKMLKLDTPLRIKALKAIGKLGSSEAIDSVIDVAMLSSESSIRNVAIETLGKLGAIKGLSLLMEWSREEATAQAVKLALKEIGKLNPDALLPFLTEQDLNIRLVAMHSLEDRKDRRLLEPFLRVLDDPDLNMQRLSAKAPQGILGRENSNLMIKL
ncbi:HEAT repeat domain-containing protein [bacterium]|nr:HEAT repeat domain-containing protein [bacterium]